MTRGQGHGPLRPASTSARPRFSRDMRRARGVGPMTPVLVRILPARGTRCWRLPPPSATAGRAAAVTFYPACDLLLDSGGATAPTISAGYGSRSRCFGDRRRRVQASARTSRRFGGKILVSTCASDPLTLAPAAGRSHCERSSTISRVDVLRSGSMGPVPFVPPLVAGSVDPLRNRPPHHRTRVRVLAPSARSVVSGLLRPRRGARCRRRGDRPGGVTGPAGAIPWSRMPCVAATTTFSSCAWRRCRAAGLLLSEQPGELVSASACRAGERAGSSWPSVPAS